MFSVEELAGLYGVDARRAEIAFLIGLASEAWGRIDDEMFRLSEWALSIHPEQMSVVYDLEPEIGARLKLTDQLLQPAFAGLPAGRKGEAAGWPALRDGLDGLIVAQRTLAGGSGNRSRAGDKALRGALRTITLSDGTKAHILRASAMKTARTGRRRRPLGQDEAEALLNAHVQAVRAAVDSLAAFRETLLTVRGKRPRATSRKRPARMRKPASGR